jgi:demethylmenaquinone methyltransferase/2-methoxy-6-polyprenyl-1,4-benzoquinol methylase
LLVERLASGLGGFSTGNPPLVLDVATGTAGVALATRNRTGARLVGLDLTIAMLEEGRQRIEREGETESVFLVAGQAERPPFPDSCFDALSFTYLLRYVPDPLATLQELGRVLRPGAPMASLEFMEPPNALWRALWWCYTRLFLPLGGMLLGGTPWARVGRFLGPSISEHYQRYSLEWTIEAWHEAGFEAVEARLMSMGGGLVMWAKRRG